jgi:hypothetical protein
MFGLKCDVFEFYSLNQIALCDSHTSFLFEYFSRISAGFFRMYCLWIAVVFKKKKKKKVIKEPVFEGNDREIDFIQ